MAACLQQWLSQQVSIITNDGRTLVGILRGVDQTTNVVLEDASERVFSVDRAVEVVPLGLYIIRGTNVAIVGQLDEEKDAQLDLSAARAAPLQPVVH